MQLLTLDSVLCPREKDGEPVAWHQVEGQLKNQSPLEAEF